MFDALLGSMGIKPEELQKAAATVQGIDGRLTAIEASLKRIEATLAAVHQIRALPAGERGRMAPPLEP